MGIAQVHPGAIDELAGLAAETGRPVQACYVLEPSAGDSPLQRLAALAFASATWFGTSGLDR